MRDKERMFYSITADKAYEKWKEQDVPEEKIWLLYKFKNMHSGVEDIAVFSTQEKGDEFIKDYHENELKEDYLYPRCHFYLRECIIDEIPWLKNET